MTIVTKKIRVLVVGDTAEGRCAGYKEIRRQCDINKRLKNFMMTHLWTEQTWKHTFVNFQNDKVFKINRDILRFMDKLSVAAKELKSMENIEEEENVKILTSQVSALEENIASLKAGRKQLMDEAYKQAEKLLTDSALGLKQGQRIYRIDSIDKDIWSENINSAKKEVTTKFKKELPDLLNGKRTLSYYRNGDVYIRGGTNFGGSTKIFINNGKYFFKSIKVPLLQLSLHAKHQNDRELRMTIEKCLTGEYSFRDSKLIFKEDKLYLLASIDIPKKEHHLDISTVVGVDLGIAVPAYCGLNNADHVKKAIGSAKDFLHVRMQMQQRRRDFQKSMTLVKGGKGRADKLQKLDKLRECERNFAKTFNHQVSKQIIDFAIKNHAGQINIEDLSFSKNDKNFSKLLRNWSYYELQQMIEYKAKANGIVVKRVDPYRTSQTCSFCGHWAEGQRDKQSQFMCKNPYCTKGKGINADWNASRNIAKNINS